MNYKTYRKEGQHLKTLLKLNKLIKEENAKCENLEHLLDGHIFYPISTWPSSIRDILEYDTITDKNTFKLTPSLNVNGISPNVFIEYLYTFILNTPSKIRKHTPITVDNHTHLRASTQIVLFRYVSLVLPTL